MSNLSAPRRKERRQEIRWWGWGAAVNQGEMKLQVLSRVLSPVLQEMFTSSSCPALSLHHLGVNFFQGRDWSGETRGNRKERDPPPYNKGPGNTLLFDLLPFEWPLLLWPVSPVEGVLVAQSLLFFQTQRPHHFRNHSSIWNSFPLQEPKAKDREDNGTPLQYSCLENPMDGGTC